MLVADKGLLSFFFINGSINGILSVHNLFMWPLNFSFGKQLEEKNGSNMLQFIAGLCDCLILFFS